MSNLSILETIIKEAKLAANGEIFTPMEPQSEAAERAANDNAVFQADFTLPDALQDKTLEEIFQNDYLTEDELADLASKCANDNFDTLPIVLLSDKENLPTLLDQVSNRLKAKMTVLKSQPLSDEEYTKQLRKVQIEAAYQLLLEYLICQDIKAIKGQKGLKKKSASRKTKKDVVHERYPRLGARQIRDFQKLELPNIYAAVSHAISISEVPTHSMALSKDIAKKVQDEDSKKTEGKMLKDWCAKEDDFETVDKTLTLEKPIVAVSLFANIGIGTSLVEKVTGIKIAVANEWDEWRGKAHRRLYPNCKTIIGSISDQPIFDEIVAESRAAGATFVFTSPPCQDSSNLNTADSKGTTERATLFADTLKNIEAVGYKAGIIENVPLWLVSRPEKALNILGDKTIGEYVLDELNRMEYKTRVGILSAADYGTAENRERCFILFWKEELGDWKFPKKHQFRPTVFEAIHMLKSLEAGEIDPDNRWHYALPLTDHEIEFLKHTPTGMSTWLNSVLYQPKNKSGSAAGASFKASYRRVDPAYPCPTITSGSGSIGDVSSVHYGRPLTEKGCYSDVRVFSIHELLLLMGASADFLDPLLPPKAFDDDFESLHWKDSMLTSKDEDNVRDALGEHVCPKMMLVLLSTFPGDKIATEAKEADK
ncbi:MAG: DNA cytosine methyltransferase [Alphaproteobacteria bacterium]|nr:DNA cytosine methyltransferase [Alphaproteobacteria bacterium]